MKKVNIDEEVRQNTIKNIHDEFKRIYNYVKGITVNNYDMDYEIIRTDNIKKIRTVINQMESQFNYNCCQENCCQTCQTVSCQSTSCQGNCYTGCQSQCISLDCVDPNCYSGYGGYGRNLSYSSYRLYQIAPMYVNFDEEYDTVPEVSLYVNGFEIEPEEVSTEGFLIPSVFTGITFYTGSDEDIGVTDEDSSIVWNVKGEKT